jgi:hypothetical protein
MASFATLTAPVKWAQRKESVLVTISLADVKDYSVFDHHLHTTMKYIILFTLYERLT